MQCKDCKNEQKIDIMACDIREIKSDIKALLAFKFQIMGAIMIMSFVITMVYNLFLKGLI